MSITRDRGMVVFECDSAGCHEALDTGRYDFSDAVTEMNEKGWRSRKDGEAWKHTCPSCQ